MTTPAGRRLLLTDAIVNLVLGAALLLFPWGADDLLGLPVAGTAFYPSLLGGVLVGIAAALLAARAGRPGLGVNGAIAINLVGAGVLVIWLIAAPPEVPARGLVLLWCIAVVVLLIAVVEIVHRRGEPETARPSDSGDPP